MLMIAGQLAGGGAAGILGSPLLPMALFVAVLYFLIIRPQQKQQKKLQAMIEALRVGDGIVTRSGIHGKVTGIDGGICQVEIAKGVQVKMNKDQVAAVVPKGSVTAIEAKK